METVESILKSLTLTEKASLCQGASFWNTKKIPDKGITAIMMTDGPHGLRKQTGEMDHLGVNKSVPSTCFPSAASISNSWDEDLIYEIGQALGKECQQEEVAVLLGPGANIKRSPLCGRNFEYFSEDPYLSSHMAKSYIMGVQSQGVGTSIKHFAVNNQETRRMTVDAVVDERALREIYLASFEDAVKEAKPWTIMAAYNKVNGEYCCENHHILQDILRREWGYEGVVVSDWGAANDQIKGIREGFDLRMPYAGEKFRDVIVEAVKEGRLSEAALDETVRRLLDLIKKGTENHREGSTYDMEAHHRLAVRAASESIVLLKNKGSVIPINKYGKIAVIGGFARNVRFQGGGSSHVNPTFREDILSAFSRVYPDISYTFAKGYRLKKDVVDEAYVTEALSNAREADKIVICLGLPDGWESEGFDREHLRIPNNQIDLLNRLAALGKPVIGLLFAGAPVEMPWIDQVDALFAMYTAGQAVSEAILRLLFGDANPCGKLSETYPISLGHTPCSLSYPQKETAIYEEGIFVGYRYYEKKNQAVQFAFGHGLSYTTWEYSNLRLDKDAMKDTGQLTVTVDVTNTGAMAGKEIVQLYVRDPESSVPKPVKELKGFHKVFCEPGGTKTVTFILDKRSFAFYNTQVSDWHVKSGVYEILVGAASDDIRLTGTVSVESTTIIHKLYDRYVTMGELMELPAGRQAMQEFMGSSLGMSAADPQAMERWLEDEDNLEDIAMDYAAMGRDMPLAKLADMSGGTFTDEMVQGILDRINDTCEKESGE